MKFKLEHATVLALCLAFGQLLTALGNENKAAIGAAMTAVFMAFMPAIQDLFNKKPVDPPVDPPIPTK